MSAKDAEQKHRIGPSILRPDIRDNPVDKDLDREFTDANSKTLLRDPRISTHQSRDETDERFLTTPEAAAYLRVSKSYLDKLRVYGGGPKFLRFGKRKVLYRKSDLDAWAAQHRFGSTSEYQCDRISLRDESEVISNTIKQRAHENTRVDSG